MALSNRGTQEDSAAVKYRAEQAAAEQLEAAIREKCRIVLAGSGGCGEVTIYFKTGRAVRITALISELLAVIM